MPFNCKGDCTKISKQQNELKKSMFKDRKRGLIGRRPRDMAICTISKYCKSCDIRFYLIDYTYCKCCGCKLRSRNHLIGLGSLDKEREKWLVQGLGAPTL